MLPKTVPEIRGEDARRLIEADKKPLSSEEKKSLEECTRVYRSVKPRHI